MVIIIMVVIMLLSILNSFIVEREGPIDGENVSNNVLHEGEKVVDFPEDTSCQDISLNNVTRDSSSRGVDLNSVQNSEKICTSERYESRTPRLVLDLSLIPTGKHSDLETHNFFCFRFI